MKNLDYKYEQKENEKMAKLLNLDDTDLSLKKKRKTHKVDPIEQKFYDQAIALGSTLQSGMKSQKRYINKGRPNLINKNSAPNNSDFNKVYTDLQ